MRALLLFVLVSCKPSSEAQAPAAERFLGSDAICRGYNEKHYGNPEIVCIRGGHRFLCLVDGGRVACAAEPPVAEVK